MKRQSQNLPNKLYKKAFTLVEFAIVITIISLLIAVVSNSRILINKAKSQKAQIETKTAPILNITNDKGVKFYIMYGQTEATARISWLPADRILSKTGSIGIAIPGGEIILEDASGNCINSPETEGELIYEGENVMMGYAKSAEDLALNDQLNGKLRTGDIAKYDKDNFDYIVLANQVKNKLKTDLASIRKSSDKYPVIEDAIRGLETDAKNLAIGPTKEQWWLLLRAAYFELEEMDKVKEVLERLVVEWSKKEYWTQLSAFYGQDRQEESQMAAYQTAYHEGFLEKSSEFVQMAQLYLSVEVPYEAAKLLQKAMDEDKLDKEVKNWKLLSQSWFLAQYDDNAILALREAAKLSDDGELDIRLARSLSNIADFKGCVDSAKVAIKKGDLKRLDDSYITLGMCQFETAMYDDSKASFASAKIDADARNEIALNECAASEGMNRETLTVTLETQKAFKDMGKEIEGKIISCLTPATVKTVQNWQKFLDKEVERVTLLQNQMKNIEEQLRSGESQALSF